MYLSKIPLDTTNRKTIIALSNPSIFHGAIDSSFKGERPRNLWRIDKFYGKDYMIVLSEQEPDFKNFARQFSNEAEYVTKKYDEFLSKIQVGSKWYFRLCANPTYTVMQGKKRGRTYPHITETFQKKWLKEKSEKHGFLLHEETVNIVKKDWYHFDKGIKKERIEISSITFEGYLTVTDTELFREALVKGIGRKKAYGQGLMTIVPTN